LFGPNKDPFHPLFVGSREYIYHCTKFAFQAVEKLAQRADIHMTVVRGEDLNIAPSGFEVKSHLSNIPHTWHGKGLPWSKLVKVMSSAKLTLPVGGLCGSLLESLYCKSLPLLCHGTPLAAPADISKLPRASEITEELFYEVLEMFWFDEEVYRNAHEYYQDVFVDHRTDGLRKCWSDLVEKLGV